MWMTVDEKEMINGKKNKKQMYNRWEIEIVDNVNDYRWGREGWSIINGNKDRKRRMKYFTIIGEKGRIIDVMINGNKNKKEKNDPWESEWCQCYGNKGGNDYVDKDIIGDTQNTTNYFVRRKRWREE